MHIASSFIITSYRFSHNRSPYPSTVYFSEMDVEQTVKDLQVQNVHFQQILLTLTKGQEELKTLLAKEKKKKAKKPTSIVIMEEGSKDKPYGLWTLRHHRVKEIKETGPRK